MAKRNPNVAGTVVAGFPSPAEQYQEQPLDLNDLLVKRPAATFFVRVQGDSMIGAGITDGDLLVVDRSLRPADGDIIIACVDGDFTVKRYREEEVGTRDQGRGTSGQGLETRDQGAVKRICLEAANPTFQTIYLRPGQELDYFGKVTACIHRF